MKIGKNVRIVEMLCLSRQIKSSIATDVGVTKIRKGVELNRMFKNWEVAKLSDRKNTLVIYGFSGSEVE